MSAGVDTVRPARVFVHPSRPQLFQGRTRRDALSLPNQQVPFSACRLKIRHSVVVSTVDMLLFGCHGIAEQNLGTVYLPIYFLCHDSLHRVDGFLLSVLWPVGVMTSITYVIWCQTDVRFSPLMSTFLISARYHRSLLEGLGSCRHQ